MRPPPVQIVLRHFLAGTVQQVHIGQPPTVRRRCRVRTESAMAPPGLAGRAAPSGSGTGRACFRSREKRLNQAHDPDPGNLSPWLLGTQFTLADTSLVCALLRLEETGWLARFAAGGRLSATLAYYDRIRARPSWQAAIEDMRHPLVERGVADLRASALFGSE